MADPVGGVGQNGQGANAEQVKFGQADGLYIAEVELGDEEAFGGQLDGDVVGQGAGGDDNAARVDAEVVGLADQGVGFCQDCF
jgi:hypothetical protein